MTHVTTEKLIGQLRILHQLTNSESQIAQSRQMQARNDQVRQHFATKSADAQERASLIAAALRDLGGVPDVIIPALGRAGALITTVVEQAQPLTGALFRDLALEHQLLDRARYLEVLAEAAEHPHTRLLARRLQGAHQETVEWITSVLAAEASGQPTAMQPTPAQNAVGRLTKAATYPTRWAAARINEAAAKRTHIIAGNLHDAASTVDQHDELTVNGAEAAVQERSDATALDTLLCYVLSDPAALDALLRFAHSHKDSADASCASENHRTIDKTRGRNGH